MKKVHNLGVVHRDIKPNNILRLSDDLKSCLTSELILIDFGIADYYLDNNIPKTHIANEKTKGFQGDMVFCSKNILLYHKHSRRDDLISLIYTLIYLLEGSLPWLKPTAEKENALSNEEVYSMKISLRP